MILKSSHLKAPHGFTQRAFGDFAKGEQRQSSENRLKEQLGIIFLQTGSQVHGNRVLWDADPVGAEGDARVCTQVGVGVAVRVADCVPVLVEGPGFVAAIHAGWRGTAADIVRVTMREVEERLGVKGAECRAVVGPCIGPCCYEVGEEVIEGVGRVAAGEDWRVGRYIDLKAVNLGILRALGVDAEAVGGCTRCSGEWWSHRRGDSGRFVGVIVVGVQG
jgi:YfiH family protein